MSEPLSVLVVEDETADFNLVVRGLKRAGIDARCLRVDNEKDYSNQLQSLPDIILSDYVMPSFGALYALKLLEESGLDIPLIVLTGMVSEETVVESMKHGAADYLLKDRMTRLGPAVMRAIKEKQLRADRRRAEARAAVAGELAQSNRELQESNRRLKETQAYLIQSEKMASLGQLVAGIAHEINNPLAFVMNNLFLVESGLDGMRLEMEAQRKLRNARALLEEMREGLDRVKELVLDLRTFSRLDEGVFKTIDVGEAIDVVLLLLNYRMGDRIAVKKRYAAKQMLFCYAGRLQQVFMNLIANAIDAIAAEGTIEIATSQTSSLFLISIRDTGAGIPEAIRGKIFDPFFTTKPVGQGTGLGLAISYGIVQDHGGSIEVESNDGAGTEFTVKIPLDLELWGKNEGKTVNP